MTSEPLTHDDKTAYLRALKTKQPTAESSAAFRKILQKAMRAADAACPPVQLSLFGEGFNATGCLAVKTSNQTSNF